jgi:hypothetical protein
MIVNKDKSFLRTPYFDNQQTSVRSTSTKMHTTVTFAAYTEPKQNVQRLE